MNAELALPETGDPSKWTHQEAALVEAAGLITVDRRTGRSELAPRATVEAFLAHCRRTRLDPIARQIYAICRQGRWGIQVSIDGARLIAERSGKYAGQTPTQWTADGQTWVDVWLDKTPPKAARIGVHRADFREPLFAVATLDAYKAGGPMWEKMPALMLGKCAEMLALRKAFPQDLSGLYSTDEMDQAGQPQEAARVEAAPEQSAPPVEDVVEAELVDEDQDVIDQWVTAVEAVTKLADLNTLYADAKEKNVHRDARVRGAFATRGAALKAAAA